MERILTSEVLPNAHRNVLKTLEGRQMEYSDIIARFESLARLAVSDKKADDRLFEPFLPVIKREAHDGRNFVKKAVNWALRQIGKRSACLHPKALETAREIIGMEAKSAKWIANDAIRELESDAVLKKIGLFS